MTEELKNIIEDYKKTKWDLLLRDKKDNMGDYHLKELKPHLDFIRHFFDSIINNDHLESSYQLYANPLENCLKEFCEIRRTIEEYRDGSQKQNIIDQVINHKTHIFQSLSPLFDLLEYQSKLHSSRVTDYPEKVVDRYNKAVKEIEQELKKIRQHQSQYAEQTVKDEAKRYGDFFKIEANNNKKLSRDFGMVFLCFSFLACLLAYCFLKFDQNITANNFAELLIKGDVINKAFIFSVILIIISVIRREYLALRHQFTVNRHRQNALNSHKEILNSILKTENESDKEISNAVLLELTKSMFNPQDTGFVKDQKNTSSESKIVEISKSLFNSSKN